MSNLSSFLMTTGRTLSQMTLYSPDHPSVKGSVEESHRYLTQMLDQAPELVLSINESKIIVNGKAPDDVSDATMRPFLQLLTAHNLHSLTFIKGIPLAQMVPFFRLASATDMRKANLNAVDFLSSQNVTHIRLNEARYAKIGEDDTVAKKGETGLGEGNGWQEFENLSLNEMLKKLVRNP